MISVDKQSRVPVYEQIKNQIVTLIRLGVYPEDSKLPSIRQVSSETSVNVNTVKKAFAELEISGVIYTVPGMGCFVSKSALENSAVTARIIRDITENFRTAKSLGVTEDSIINILKSIYGGEEK
ncbi:MAG: GntR family transcriptional regulator [Clostridia bacterium]|nr:GntR family transcriptional regulator [Clostridia bacterium]